jgi:hypothetical protein
MSRNVHYIPSDLQLSSSVQVPEYITHPMNVNRGTANSLRVFVFFLILSGQMAGYYVEIRLYNFLTYYYHFDLHGL